MRRLWMTQWLPAIKQGHQRMRYHQSNSIHNEDEQTPAMESALNESPKHYYHIQKVKNICVISLSTWYKSLGHLKRKNLSWESISSRLADRQECGALCWLMIDVGAQRKLSSHSKYHPWAGLGSIKKQAKQTTRSKPVRGIPPWSQLRFMPQLPSMTLW